MANDTPTTEPSSGSAELTAGGDHTATLSEPDTQVSTVLDMAKVTRTEDSVKVPPTDGGALGVEKALLAVKALHAEKEEGLLADKKSVEEAAQLEQQAEQFRSASKWIVGAFAAVAGVLLTGLQLTALAKADADDHVEGLVFVAVAIFGVLLVIVAHAAVLTSGRAGIRGFARGKKGWPLGLKRSQRRFYTANLARLVAPTLRIEDGSVATLPQFIELFDRRMAANAQPPITRDGRATLNMAMFRVKRNLQFAQVRFRFSVAIVALVVGAVVCATGVVGFAMSTGESTVDTDKPTTEANAAIATQLTPDDDAVILINSVAGEKCASTGEAVDAVVYEATDDNVEVVTVPTENCAPARLTIPADSVVVTALCPITLPTSTTVAPTTTAAPPPTDPPVTSPTAEPAQPIWVEAC